MFKRVGVIILSLAAYAGANGQDPQPGKKVEDDILVMSNGTAAVTLVWRIPPPVEAITFGRFGARGKPIHRAGRTKSCGLLFLKEKA